MDLILAEVELVSDPDGSPTTRNPSSSPRWTDSEWRSRILSHRGLGRGRCSDRYHHSNYRCTCRSDFGAWRQAATRLFASNDVDAMDLCVVHANYRCVRLALPRHPGLSLRVPRLAPCRARRRVRDLRALWRTKHPDTSAKRTQFGPSNPVVGHGGPRLFGLGKAQTERVADFARIREHRKRLRPSPSRSSSARQPKKKRETETPWLQSFSKFLAHACLSRADGGAELLAPSELEIPYGSVLWLTPKSAYALRDLVSRSGLSEQTKALTIHGCYQYVQSMEMLASADPEGWKASAGGPDEDPEVAKKATETLRTVANLLGVMKTEFGKDRPRRTGYQAVTESQLRSKGVWMSANQIRDLVSYAQQNLDLEIIPCVREPEGSRLARLRREAAGSSRRRRPGKREAARVPFASYAVSFNAANDVAEGDHEKGYGIKLCASLRNLVMTYLLFGTWGQRAEVFQNLRQRNLQIDGELDPDAPDARGSLRLVFREGEEKKDRHNLSLRPERQSGWYLSFLAKRSRYSPVSLTRADHRQCQGDNCDPDQLGLIFPNTTTQSHLSTYGMSTTATELKVAVERVARTFANDRKVSFDGSLCVSASVARHLLCTHSRRALSRQHDGDIPEKTESRWLRKWARRTSTGQDMLANQYVLEESNGDAELSETSPSPGEDDDSQSDDGSASDRDQGATNAETRYCSDSDSESEPPPAPRTRGDKRRGAKLRDTRRSKRNRA